MGFYDPRIWPKKDHAIYESYLDKLTSFAIWVAKEGYEIRLFTTDPGVDRYALPDLKIRLSTHLSADLVREIKSDSVSRMLKQMAEFNVVVTSKFHGIVFSHLLNKPVISLSYHEKMDCIMRAAGQGRFCTSIETFDRSWLISAFRLLVAESPAIKGYYPAMVARNAAMLSGQLDDLFGIYMPHPQRDLDRSADCPHERTSLSIVSHEKEVPSS
jgi:polysaccharide pyruvyl transferase WcaK-like protein